ncbi:MAG: RNA polymerase sigma factor [Bacteroidia bacterium]|nr:RNA polymerase sigma factor [Bacteroidia bacterium]
MHTDKEIIVAFKIEATKERAFKQLLNQFKQQVYWQIRRIVISHDDADDLCQNVFIKVWQKLGEFREDSALSSWLYRIAHNESLSFLRSKKNLTSLDEVMDRGGDLSHLVDSGVNFDGDKIEAKLQKALLLLPEKQRQTFNMRYYDDLKYEEISAILGTSVGALKANYHLAVKKIEESLKRD